MATHSSILAWRSPWMEEPSKPIGVAKCQIGLKQLSMHTHSNTLKILICLSLSFSSPTAVMLFWLTMAPTDTQALIPETRGCYLLTLQI